MPHIIEISSLDAPELAVYAHLTESQLRNRLNPDEALFIAESPKVIRVAFDAGYEAVSMLCERRHVDGDAADIIARCPSMPVYTACRDVLARLTGYDLTRGVLCAMRRRPQPEVGEVCRGARRVVVVDGVVEATNVGAIFRSAAALGVDAVLVTPNSCDPLVRRAVRVSMGSVFLVPWAWLPTADGAAMTDLLHGEGFRVAAMALSDDSVSLADARLAIVMGTEGDGLPHATIAAADYVVRIPMKHGVDSLNVAAASAVAFWQLCRAE